METGIPIRIKRGGEWQNLDIAELTDDELENFFAPWDQRSLARWAKTLAAWIRDNVQEQPAPVTHGNTSGGDRDADATAAMKTR